MGHMSKSDVHVHFQLVEARDDLFKPPAFGLSDSGFSKPLLLVKTTTNAGPNVDDVAFAITATVAPDTRGNVPRRSRYLDAILPYLHRL